MSINTERLVILFEKLASLGIKGKIHEVTMDLFKETMAAVRIGDHRSSLFEIQSGVMQGSKLGPLLFIIFLNDLLLELESMNIGVKIGNSSVTTLNFTDDIVLITDTPEKLQEFIMFVVDGV